MKGQLFRRITAMGLTLCMFIGMIPVSNAADQDGSSAAPYSDAAIDYIPFQITNTTVSYEVFRDFLVNTLGMSGNTVTAGTITITPNGGGKEPMELAPGGTVALSEGKYEVVVSAYGGLKTEIGYFETTLAAGDRLTLFFSYDETDVYLVSEEGTVTLTAGNNTITSGKTYTLRLSRKTGYTYSASYAGGDIVLSLDSDDFGYYIGTFTPGAEGTLTISLIPTDVYSVSVCSNLEDYGTASIVGTTASSYSGAAGDKLTLKAEAKAGCSFYGWKITSGGVSTLLENKDSAPVETMQVTVHENVTYTALFEQPEEDEFLFQAGGNAADLYLGSQVPEAMEYAAGLTAKQYTITFVSMGGTAVEPITQDYNTLVTPPAIPTREGYTFDGWYTGESGAGTRYFASDGAEVRMLGDLTLYAKWTVQSYPVLLDTDGGTLNQTYPNTACGDMVDLSDYVPEKAGYKFVGWFTEDNRQIITYTMKAEALELTARYTSYLDLLRNIDIEALQQDDTALAKAREYYLLLNEAQVESYTGTQHQTAIFERIREISLQELAKSIEGAVESANDLLRDDAVVSLSGSSFETMIPDESLLMEQLIGVPFLEKLFVHDGVVDISLNGQESITKLTEGKLMLSAAYAAIGEGYSTLDDFSSYLEGAKDTLRAAALDGSTITVKVNAETAEGVSYGLDYTLHFFNDTHTVFWLDEDGETILDETSCDYNEAIEAPTVEKAGYTLTGWKNANGIKVDLGSVKMGMTDVSYTALWSAVIRPEPADYTALNEAVASVPSNTEGYTAESVEAMNKALAAVEYGLTEERQNDVDAWTEAILAAVQGLTPRSLTITFDPGQGSAGFSSKLVSYLSPFGVLPTAERTGYSFVGWFTAKEGGTQVTAQTVMTETGNMTLYARYAEEKGDYSIVDRYLTLIREAGDLSVYEDESVAAIRAAEAAVVRDLGATQQARIDEMARSLQSAWNARAYRRVSVRFDAGGGECDTTVIQYRYGEPYSPLPAVTRKGYTFLGWFTEKNSGTKVEIDMLMKQLEDHTLYARWQWRSGDYDKLERALARIPADLTPYTDETRQNLRNVVENVEYGLGAEEQSRIDGWTEAINKAVDGLVKKTLTVSFDPCGGKVSPNTQTVSYGSAAALPVPARNGYTFDGWYTAASGGIRYTDSTAITAYLTLYAHWTEAPADYSEVYKAISAIPADLSIYTKGSAAALAAARDAVKQGLGAGAQSKVDGWAAAILSAIDGLVRRLPFTDVQEGDWFYSYVSELYHGGIVNGTGDGTTYSPYMVTDRAQMAVLLYRISGSPKSSGKHPFTDVPKDSYFYDAVCWAYESGVVNGTGDGSTYSPYMGITREMFATMLYRLFGEPKLGGSLSGFPDGTSVSGWAMDGVTWAVETGIITGKGDGTLAPQAEATRAEVATMLQRYMKLVK